MSSALYRFTVPPTREQGSHSGNCRDGYGETYRKDALRDYNSARAHDGLDPIARMPRGTRYARILPAIHPGDSPEEQRRKTGRAAGAIVDRGVYPL